MISTDTALGPPCLCNMCERPIDGVVSRVARSRKTYLLDSDCALLVLAGQPQGIGPEYMEDAKQGAVNFYRRTLPPKIVELMDDGYTGARAHEREPEPADSTRVVEG